MDINNKKNNIQQELKILFIASWPPKECGIATFTEDLRREILKVSTTSLVYIIAINDIGKKYEYGGEVKCEIDQEYLDSLDKAARYVNESGADIVSIQHEFGIWGGFDGEFIEYFIRKIKIPIVTTIHTVPMIAQFYRRKKNKMRLIKDMAKYSKKVIVTMEGARSLLHKENKIPLNKIEVVPHGAPDMEFVEAEKCKEKVGLSGKKVISTFGLITLNKGLEFVIKAMPKILVKHPDIVYQILGRIHPTILGGRKYYSDLQELVLKLKLDKNVIFVNKYLEREELVKFLQATDIYIIPYPGMGQASSGTLAYAMTAGKCVVSTPFAYAEDLLGEGRGFFIEPKNSDDIADKINYLFDHPEEIRKKEKLAYEYGRRFTWPKVAERYFEVFGEAVKKK